MRIPTSKQDKGFTLIELLVVVVIIGILAAVAIPVFLSQREKAIDAGTKSDLKNAATLMETYYVDTQGYGTAGAAVKKSATDNAAPQLAELKVSDGVTITVAFVRAASGNAPSTFCLTGTNAKSPGVYRYDPTDGGLTPGACTALLGAGGRA